MTKLLPLVLLFSAFIAACGGSARMEPRPKVAASFPNAPASLPPLPVKWPASTLQLGLSNDVGAAAELKSAAPFGFRYHYLAGGVNTGAGWESWKPADWLKKYLAESKQAGLTPVLTYYNLRQSKPGASMDEAKGDYENLQNKSTMQAYWQDLTKVFRQAGAAGTTVVLHVEPDLWGYMQQRAGHNDATTVNARVGTAEVKDLEGLPDNMQGFAQAVARLRDKYAPNVLLGYHLSVWGTGQPINHQDDMPDAEVEQLARKAADYYKTLGVNFDLVFAEFSDRDAGYKQTVDKDKGRSWWNEADFAHNVRFLSSFVQATGKRIVMWQIPLGNTKMRALNNTKGHYQDNRVEWLLDDPTGEHLRAYRDAGVIALLFGGGSVDTTCACDARGDGVTNPKAINGNEQQSFTADDDGGYFKKQAAAYYSRGPLGLTLAAASGKAR